MTQLFAFACDGLHRRSRELGFDALIVDLEREGKHDRQSGFDTQISAHTIDDLVAIRPTTDARIICRIDAMSADSRRQIDAVISAGADEILVPMVRRVTEIEHALSVADGRAGVGVMIETTDSLRIVETLAELPISRGYLGLNDLWIERRTPNRFTALSDGTTDKVASAFGDIPFGVAGLTHPRLGSPLPCRHLVNELSRLGCDFTFLRRAFLAAISTMPAVEVIADIRSALAAANSRSPAQVDTDRRLAHAAIDSLPVEHAPDSR